LRGCEIVSQDKKLNDLVTEYDLACPLPDCAKLTAKLLENSEEMIVKLEDAVNCDLQFRNRVVAKSIQILEEEMFLFGRPLFQLLQPFGLLVMQSGNRLILRKTDLVKVKRPMIQ
jgi:hypothetical protein